MVSRELLERIRDYLNEMFKDNIKIMNEMFKDNIKRWPGLYLYYIEERGFGNIKWYVRTNLMDGVGVMGLVDGRIEVDSHVLGENYEEALEIITADLYRRRLERARSEEEKKKIQEERRKEIREVLDDLIDKRWDKYIKDKRLRRRYGSMTFKGLYWGEEVARRIREKYGMDIEFRVGPRGKTGYFSIFDPSGMSEEQIFEEIVKRIRMIYDAYESNHNRGEKVKFEKEFEAKWRLGRRRRRR
ncbi:MAG: hypothetical protein QXI42_04255 [Thermoproteota archaeon]|nr:hypothetical protein [Candidatus Brockarchaeota archaeon]